MTHVPVAILVFSGKRKSGKDYVTEKLLQRIGNEKCCIMRLSAPLKGQYAKEHQLDITRLLDASEYKERYRVDMIRWGEEKRNADPGYFCRIVTSGEGSDKKVWIISDARRSTDIAFFKQNYPSVTWTVRVEADEDVRKARGYVFQSGVDDAESECGLDSVTDWDYIFQNNNNINQFETSLDTIVDDVQKKLDVASS
ncbi:phosphomevalonate kinase-like [Haliotis asinina]|uniref:phosphomevalonate kinase-like n=1 Tax=Haliotis asinina TaxID=109174 RepID=UPI00353240A3